MRIEHEHSGLQWDMALFGRAQPGSIGKGNAAEADVGKGMVEAAVHLNERHQRGRDDLRHGEVFAGARPIIDFSGPDILEPFAGGIEERKGIDEVERRGVVRIDGDRRPGMLELDLAFGLLEGDQGAVVFDPEIFDTQIGDLPDLVNHHLERSGTV